MKAKVWRPTWVVMLLVWVLLLASPLAAQQKPLRLLVVTGGHAYSTSFYKVFLDKADWTWDHGYPAAQAYRSDLRKAYDVLVLYDMTEPDIGEKAQKNLRDFIDGGGGVVVLHHAILNRGYGEWWYRDVVGGLYLREPMLGVGAKSSFQHDVELVARPTGDHPIVKGLGSFHITDETYKNQWISPKAGVILETDHPSSDGPLAWICPYDKARIVYIELGHGPEAHLNAKYQELVRRAVLWTAGRLE